MRLVLIACLLLVGACGNHDREPIVPGIKYTPKPNPWAPPEFAEVTLKYETEDGNGDPLFCEETIAVVYATSGTLWNKLCRNFELVNGQPTCVFHPTSARPPENWDVTYEIKTPNPPDTTPGTCGWNPEEAI